MYHYLILNQSLFYHNLNPKRLKKPRKAKRTTKISQSSRPIHLVVDETVYKEWEDRMERAVTTASSLVAEQDSGNINRTQFMATLNESFLQETGSGSGPRCQDTILRVQKLKLGKGFSGKVTPLFETMMVQATEDMGEDSAVPTDSHSTPIHTQPSSSKPQNKKSRRK
ncbi:hypothetical protein Tco_0624914 [Tanacetum coccineum]|uniref:Uncharacterized protein n=1 Tax=Tanacetum coccineum TaxID=301880 RepID=A0ABQ4WFE2_9ASTR